MRLKFCRKLTAKWVFGVSIWTILTHMWEIFFAVGLIFRVFTQSVPILDLYSDLTECRFRVVER